jgi:hypothetical protein
MAKMSPLASTRQSVRLVPKGCRDWIRRERDTSTSLFSLAHALWIFENLTGRHTSSSTLMKFSLGTTTKSNGFPLRALSKSALSALHQSKEERRMTKRCFTLLRRHTVTMTLSMCIPEKSPKGSMVSAEACSE